MKTDDHSDPVATCATCESKLYDLITDERTCTRCGKIVCRWCFVDAPQLCPACEQED